MRKQKFLKVAGYLGFAGLSLLLFFYFTFPAEAVGQRLAQEVQKMSDGKVTVAFDEVSLYRISGLLAEGVKVTRVSDSGEAVEIDIDELCVRLQLLPLLMLNLSASIEAELGDGEIEAMVTKTGESIELELDISELDLAFSPALGQLAGLPLRGRIEGTIEAKIGYGDKKKGSRASSAQIAPERSEGQGNLKIAGLSFGPGAISGFTIPTAVSLGQLEIGLEMKRGRAQITRLEQTGGDLALQGTGSVNLRQTLRMSNLDTCLKLKVDEDFSKKYPKLDVALQLAQVRFKKDGEGFMNIKLGGKLTSPRPQRGLCRAERSRRGREAQ